MNNLTALLTQHPIILIILAGFMGVIVGSFLNVVIYRLPKMIEQAKRRECDHAKIKATHHSKYNLVSPRSACPHCNEPIRALENIPIVSYLLLRGKCNHCKELISIRYPVVEFLSGLLTAYITWRFGWSTHTILSSIFLLSLLTLTCIDLETQLLPDNITFPLIWLGLLVNLNNEFTTTESAVIGAVVGYLTLWTTYWLHKILTNKEGMGYGDFKMLAAIGAWLGWQSLPLVILISALTGVCVAIALIFLKRFDLSQPIPFGPYLALACIIVFFRIQA